MKLLLRATTAYLGLFAAFGMQRTFALENGRVEAPQGLTDDTFHRFRFSATTETKPVLVSFAQQDYPSSEVLKTTFQTNLRAMRQRINRLLCHTANAEILQTLQENNIKIILRPKSAMRDVAGAYDKDSNSIAMIWDSTFSDSVLVSILSNEVSTAVICATNLKAGKSVSECLTPPNPKKLINQITDGYQKIRHLEKEYKKNPDSQEIIDFLEAVRDYMPQKHEMIITSEQHQTLLNYPTTKMINSGTIYLPPGASGPFPTGFSNNCHRYIDFHYSSEGFVYYMSLGSSTNAHSQAEAFFYDMRIVEARYATGGSYTSDIFYSGGLANQVTERLSDIDMLPASLQKLFFAPICKAMSRFHQVKDYCNKPALRS